MPSSVEMKAATMRWSANSSDMGLGHGIRSTTLSMPVTFMFAILPPMTTPRPTIERQYADARPKSKALYARARAAMPSGAAHDSRYFAPFPFYVERAEGARKWDVDGHEYLDCWSGHGALMLGHNHPATARAIAEQARRGLHYSACHELEVRWAELIREIVPGADYNRGSGIGWLNGAMTDADIDRM